MLVSKYASGDLGWLYIENFVDHKSIREIRKTKWQINLYLIHLKLYYPTHQDTVIL